MAKPINWEEIGEIIVCILTEGADSDSLYEEFEKIVDVEGNFKALEAFETEINARIRKAFKA